MRRMKHRVAFHGLCAGLALAMAHCSSAGSARADQVTSKGTVLRGKITGVSSAGITFEPEYGKGALTIKWEDIEDLKTDGNFQVLYGDDEESDTPLAGYTDGTLFAGAAVEGATQIPIDTIHSGVPIGPDGPGWRDRLRSSWRYWDGNFDFAFNAQQATIDTTGLLLDFKTTRKKDPTRLILGADLPLRDAEGRAADPDRRRSEHDYPGPAVRPAARRVRHHCRGSTPSARARRRTTAIQRIEHPRHSQARPRLSLLGAAARRGPAQLLRRRGRRRLGLREVLRVDRGLPTTTTSPSPSPLVAGYHLPYGAHFDGRVDYLPAVDDFTGDYLLRSQAALTHAARRPDRGEVLGARRVRQHAGGGHPAQHPVHHHRALARVVSTREG